MPDGPDVRALTYLLSAEANGHRPVRCTGCPFARPYLIGGGRVRCDLLGGGPLADPAFPPCTPEDWGDRARQDLARLLSDNALLAAVAHDAREESSMYNRGLAEGAAAEREANCKAVCPDCAAGDRPWPNEVGDYWHGKPGSFLPGRWKCKADAIRRRSDEDGR